MKSDKILEALLDSLSIEQLQELIEAKKGKQTPAVKPMTELEQYRFLVRRKLKAKLHAPV